VFAKTGLKSGEPVGQPELRERGGATARGSREAAHWERRRRDLSGERLEESLKQREEQFRFAGDRAAASENDLAEEGEAPARAALKGGAPKQLGFTFHFDTIAESCESSSAMTVLE
jgi:hypothetical protein